MADQVLCIDAGNSAVKWALSSSDGLSEMTSLSYPENISADFFIKAWKQWPQDKPLSVIASCVASEFVWQALVNACNDLWGINIQRVVSLEKGFGLVNAYRDEASLGSDRWCAMIGGLSMVNSSFLVIDAGSAFTIDMVDARGKHLGGYIVPGLAMMRKSLGLDAAQIKNEQIENNRPSLLFANSTSECINAGIYFSAVNMIESVYAQESKKTKNLICFLTGGDAQSIANLLGFKTEFVPDLVLRGLAVIAARDNNN